MWSWNRLLVVCALAFGSSSIACGGSTDSSGPDGQTAGSAGRDDTNTAGRAGAGNGGAPSTANGTKLSEIVTDAQALAVCNRIRDGIDLRELDEMLSGSCAIAGQTAELQQLGTCEEVQAQCVSEQPTPTTDDGSCTADDIPDCDNVTVDEYVKCTHDTIALGVDYLSAITCDTDLETLQDPGIAASCRGPYERCPEYAGK